MYFVNNVVVKTNICSWRLFYFINTAIIREVEVEEVRGGKKKKKTTGRYPYVSHFQNFSSIFENRKSWRGKVPDGRNYDFDTRIILFYAGTFGSERERRKWPPLSFNGFHDPTSWYLRDSNSRNDSRPSKISPGGYFLITVLEQEVEKERWLLFALAKLSSLRSTEKTS